MNPGLSPDIVARLIFGGGLLLGALLLAVVSPTGRTWRARVLDTAVVMLGTISLLHYLQLPPFAAAADRPAHVHDLVHYWLGARYFPETGYQRQYVCFLQASGNDFGAVYARDLRDKKIKPVEALLSDPDLACHSRFTPERWAAYIQDVRTVRGWAPAQAWQKFVQDFGFNPPPTWLIAGYPLASGLEMSTGGVYLITLLDPLLLILGILAAGAAFGPVPTALAALGMTSFVPASASWTIGSFLRWDWLFWMLMSVAAARRNMFALSGAAFGISAAIRIFPVSALVVLALYAALAHRARQSLAAPARFVAGLVAAVASVMLVSLAMFGLEQWRDFLANLATLGQSYGINFMGLRTVLSFLWSLWTAGSWYPPETVLAELKQQSLGHIWWIHAAIALGVLSLYRRIAGLPFWVVLLTALAWIPFSWAEMASYYYMFWGALFLLSGYRRVLALPLAACNVVSTLLLLWLGKTPHLYAAISATACVAILAQLMLVHRSAATVAQPPRSRRAGGADTP